MAIIFGSIQSSFLIKGLFDGDYVVTNRMIMVASNKALLVGQNWFKNLLSCTRAYIENMTGIWQGRFPFLHKFQLKIKNKNH
jgi:hypothetical protein